METINPLIIYFLIALIVIFITILFGKKILQEIKAFFIDLFVENYEQISGEVVEIYGNLKPDNLLILNFDLNLLPPPMDYPIFVDVHVKQEDGIISCVRMEQDTFEYLKIRLRKIVKLQCRKSKYDKSYYCDQCPSSGVKNIKNKEPSISFFDYLFG